MFLRRITLLVIGLALLVAAPVAAQDRTTVRVLHFADYHAHAVPFYSEGEQNTAGIARLIGYLNQYADDPNTLIFNGGDMQNLGVPAWSDKFQCAEWPWFNGIVDAMAYGNHDSDYGPEVFRACQEQIDYPILSINAYTADGTPFFQRDGRTYEVFEIDGIRIGVFAVAGSDFERLIRPELRAVEGMTFGDRISAAREVVRQLREEEQVNAVLVIGHSLYEDDVALAQQVPGIDIIFGSHSHLKRELELLPGTSTYSISPYQYLTYVSNLELTFEGGELTDVTGGLVRMSNTLPEDPEIAGMVAQMQAELEADPQFAPFFQPIGAASMELAIDGLLNSETVFGNFVMDIFRERAGSHLAVSTSSSFRAALPPGELIEEQLRMALPYTNRILTYEMSGEQVRELLNYSASRSGSDFFSQMSGARFTIVNGQVDFIEILADPANPSTGFVPLDPAATYSVATTDFQGRIAPGYSDIFGAALSETDTQIDVRTMVRDYIAANSPVSGQLDGRISTGSAPAPEAEVAPEVEAAPEAEEAPIPAALPNTGNSTATPALVPVLAAALVLFGVLLRRQVR